MPPTFSGSVSDPQVPAHLIQTITQAPAFISYVTKRKDSRILVVAGMASIITNLRARGFNAFGAHTYDGLGTTRWHAVMEPEKMAFRPEQFHSVYWLHPNHIQDDFLGALAQVIPLISWEGFLMFDESIYPQWSLFLRYMAWDKLPFKEGVLSIWRKPAGELRQGPPRIKGRLLVFRNFLGQRIPAWIFGLRQIQESA